MPVLSIFLKISRRLSFRALATFFFCLFLCFLVAVLSIKNKSDLEEMNMGRLIIEKSIAINDTISTLLFKTQILASLIIQNDGHIENFERAAASIVDSPAILNILIAPGGVVTNVFPLDGNQGVLGLNFFEEGAGNREARLALEKGQLVFGGPFDLRQGGEALVGRLPVWLEKENNRKFWGLVSVTLHYPSALEGAGLETLAAQGFVFEIWRINPDNGERQIIAASGDIENSGLRFIEEHIPLMNADWYFRIAPIKRWYQHFESWLLIFAGLIISLLVAALTQTNEDLRHMQRGLENMVNTDPLTGLLNRNGLLPEVDKLVASRTPFQLFYLDLNYFKQINDTYGHNVGDYVLTEFSRTLRRHMDAGSILSRVSGDEFVLLYPAASPEAAGPFWRRVAEELSRPICLCAGDEIFISFSRGSASFPEEAETVQDLICRADKKMYAQKNAKYSKECKRRSEDRLFRG